MTEIARVDDYFDHRIFLSQLLQLGHRAILRMIVDEDQLEFVLRLVSYGGLDLRVEFIDIFLFVITRSDYAQESSF